MRTIQKGTEPHSLTEHRAQAHSDFDNLSDSAKDILREMLVFEQRGICCYCMSRIRPNPDGTKIEHWRPQSRYPTEQLEYRNLLAACMGNEGAPKKMQHCDTFKSDMDLSKNPAEPSHHVEDGIGYKADGSVYSSDPDFDDELNHVLNLNIHFLKTNRKAVLDSFLRAFHGSAYSKDEFWKSGRGIGMETHPLKISPLTSRSWSFGSKSVFAAFSKPFYVRTNLTETALYLKNPGLELLRRIVTAHDLKQARKNLPCFPGIDDGVDPEARGGVVRR